MTAGLVKADLWLLDRVFQRASDAATDRFGLNCFALAKAALVGAGACDVVRLVPERWRWLTVELSIKALMLAAVIGQEARLGAAPRLANPWRLWSFPRLVMASAVLAGLAPDMLIAASAFDGPDAARRIAEALRNPLLLLAVYWQCCTPRPPRPVERRADAAVCEAA